MASLDGAVLRSIGHEAKQTLDPSPSSPSSPSPPVRQHDHRRRKTDQPVVSLPDADETAVDRVRLPLIALPLPLPESSKS